MARAQQKFQLLVADSSGSPWTGQTVELKRGASTVLLTEVGNGWYKTDAIDVGQWSVYVNSTDQGRTVPIGAGEVDVPDYTNNPDSNYTTDSSGVPQLSGPNSVVTSLTIGGVSGVTGAIDTDSAYLRNSGTPTTGNIPKWNADTQQLEDSGKSADNLITTSSFVEGQIPQFDANGDLVDSGKTVNDFTETQSFTSGNLAQFDTNGDLVDSGEQVGDLAVDSQVVHISGTETITGAKNFTGGLQKSGATVPSQTGLVNGNIVASDSNQNLVDTGKTVNDFTETQSFTDGNLAEFDSVGDLVDTGKTKENIAFKNEENTFTEINNFEKNPTYDDKKLSTIESIVPQENLLQWIDGDFYKDTTYLKCDDRSGNGLYAYKIQNSEKWNSRASAADNGWLSICWSPELSLFCAVANTGTGDRVMTSPDGITWTSRASATDNEWRAICWSPELSLFCAVASSGTGNRVMTSPDGITWTSRASATDNGWLSICWSPELSLFCAVSFTGTGDRVMTSPDGITWTSRASATDNGWLSICWSPELSLFCAVSYTGTGNRVMTSPDGITWTSRASATDNEWRAICWSPELSLFCAVASLGTGDRVMTSPDGITWTSRASATDNRWLSICWSPELSLFCAVSFTGTGDRVMTSPDGITWTSRASATDNWWRAICWSPELSLFCAVADTGTGNRVMTSEEELNLNPTADATLTSHGFSNSFVTRRELEEKYDRFVSYTPDRTGPCRFLNYSYPNYSDNHSADEYVAHNREYLNQIESDKSGSLILPKASKTGFKVDKATPTFPWHDIIGDLKVRGAGATDPDWVAYRGGVRQYQFDLNDELWFSYHIPHDYLKGSDIYIHIHWSHITAGTPTGSVTWSFESTYAKRTGAFGATKTVTTGSISASAQYTHVVSETQLSSSGGSATLLNTDDLEPDGVILMRIALTANSLSGATKPFAHTADVHYQSTGLGTKNKDPDFYA